MESAVRGRGTDIARVRPEWALANNAALIAAPRSRTAGLKLDGRVFLHEYDPEADPRIRHPYGHTYCARSSRELDRFQHLTDPVSTRSSSLPEIKPSTKS